MPPTFDVQLCERFLQRSLDGGNLFGGMIFLHGSFCASDCFLSRRFIDDLSLQRHIGKHLDTFSGNFDETFADGQ